MRCVFAAALLVACGLVVAQESETSSPTIWVAGIGNQSCGALMKFLDGPEANETIERFVMSWVDGFVTGLNIERAIRGGSQVKPPDHPTIKLYLVKHCRENPLDTAGTAAAHMARELRERGG
jgi:hypothetical protein